MRKSLAVSKLIALAAFVASTAISAGVLAQEPEKDGTRFRGGVSAVAGGFVGDYSGFQAGVDGRMGVQINNLIGVYANPMLTFGPLKVSDYGLSTVVGVFALTGMVDFTLFDKLSFGAGGGYGVVNNPSGPMLQFRVGC